MLPRMIKAWRNRKYASKKRTSKGEWLRLEMELSSEERSILSLAFESLTFVFFITRMITVVIRERIEGMSGYQDELDRRRLHYSLEGKRIVDLKPYLHLLGSFHSLRYLSLRNNLIEEIPREMTNLVDLQQLDLTSNPVRDIDQTLSVLKQLKRLKALSIDVQQGIKTRITAELPQLEYLNKEEVRSLSDRLNWVDWEPVRPSIEADHLVEVSKIFELIVQLLLNQQGDKCNEEFLRLIKTVLSLVHQNLGAVKEKPLRAMLITRSRVQIQEFCMQRILKYLESWNMDLKILLESLLRMQSKAYSQMEKIVFCQSKTRMDEEAVMKSREVTSLKSTIIELKEDVRYLESRVAELERDNEAYLQRLINYSKGESSSLNNLAFDTKYKDVRLLSYSTPIETPTQKKTLSLTQLEDTIHDIYDKKAKHESASKKRTTMALFLKTFFLISFGKDLAEENESVFRESLTLQSATQQNSVVLFLKILGSECEEEYIQEQKLVFENLTRKLRQFMSERESSNANKRMTQDQLSKVLDSKFKIDISIEASSLKCFLREILSEDELDFVLQKVDLSKQTSFEKSKANKSFTKLLSRANSLQLFQVASIRQVVNIILNLKLKQHLQKIEAITQSFRLLDEDRDGVISARELREIVQLEEEVEEAIIRDEKVMYSDVVREVLRKRKRNRKEKE